MTEISQCQIESCGKPLGQESKDAGFVTCHEHRSCSICHENVQAGTIRIIHNQSQAHDESFSPSSIIHNHCALLDASRLNHESPSHTSVTLAEIDLINRSRFFFNPQPELGIKGNVQNALLALPYLIKDMNLEQQFTMMKVFESCAAATSLLLKKDRKAIEEEIKDRTIKEQKEVENIRTKKATQSPDTNLYGYTQKVWDNMTKVEKMTVKKREKHVETLGSLGIDRDKALEIWVKAQGV